MINSNTSNSIKTIVRRFVSLPPQTRMEIAAKLLRWRDENNESEKVDEESLLSFAKARSGFLERFWDEVEAAHADGLYTDNPFAQKVTQPVFYSPGSNLLDSLMCAC